MPGSCRKSLEAPWQWCWGCCLCADTLCEGQPGAGVSPGGTGAFGKRFSSLGWGGGSLTWIRGQGAGSVAPRRPCRAFGVAGECASRDTGRADGSRVREEGDSPVLQGTLARVWVSQQQVTGCQRLVGGQRSPRLWGWVAQCSLPCRMPLALPCPGCPPRSGLPAQRHT